MFTEVNGVIQDTFLGFSNTGMFTFQLKIGYLDEQVAIYGRVALDEIGSDGAIVHTPLCSRFVSKILYVANKPAWEALRGTPVRIRLGEDGSIAELGNFLKDRWLNIYNEIEDNQKTKLTSGECFEEEVRTDSEV